MNSLIKSQLTGVKDEAIIYIEYQTKGYKPPEFDRITIPFDRQETPNTVLSGRFKAKVPLRDDINSVGKSEVSYQIPCFREEVEEVYELVKKSGLKRVLKNVDKIQSDVTKEELKKLEGLSDSYG